MNWLFFAMVSLIVGEAFVRITIRAYREFKEERRKRGEELLRKLS